MYILTQDLGYIYNYIIYICIYIYLYTCVCVPSRNQDDNFLTRAAPQPDADFLW
mgnify:CR=1 FL=1